MSGEEEGRRYHGVEVAVRTLGGAKASRVMHPGNQKIDTHKHDWACITIALVGSGREVFEGGEARLDGPCAILHPAGSYHGDEIGPSGLETFSIQFDPEWLGGGPGLKSGRSSAWTGAGAAAVARRLAAAWNEPGRPESALKEATVEFVRRASGLAPAATPAWIERIREETGGIPTLSTAELARRVGLHPVWVARSYRRAMGEGLADARRRHRVAAAAQLLRRSDKRLAEVAAASGFCDQSHMNRNFLEVLGRTPLQVREERRLFAAQVSPAA
ncbi:MAG TPA: AraC family transcriptional regulator [Allosphingosinicella sp.]|jgi:AraC family transcriptional regulator